MSDLEARLKGLEQRVGELEDINAIRRLHWAYGYYCDFNRAEDIVGLFAADGIVVFLSGEYHGHAGVRRLYGTWFQQYFTQGVNGPVDGLLLDHFQMQDIVTVAPDRRSAKGRFRGLLPVLGIAVGQHEIDVRGRERARDTEADARYAAGDERRLALEVHTRTLASLGNIC